MTKEEEDLFAALEASMDEVDVSDVLPVSEMKTADLLDLYSGTTSELFDEREAIHPKTREARDTHSRRYAALLELRKRQIL